MGRKYKIGGVVVASTGGGGGNFAGDAINRFKNWWDEKVDKPTQDRLKGEPWWVKNLAKLVSLVIRLVGSVIIGVIGAIIMVFFSGKRREDAPQHRPGQRTPDADQDASTYDDKGEEEEEEGEDPETPEVDPEEEEEEEEEEEDQNDSIPRPTTTSADDDETSTNSSNPQGSPPPVDQFPSQTPGPYSPNPSEEHEPLPWENPGYELPSVEVHGPTINADTSRGYEDEYAQKGNMEYRIRRYDDGSMYVEAHDTARNASRSGEFDSNGDFTPIPHISERSEGESFEARQSGFERRANQHSEEKRRGPGDLPNDPKQPENNNEVKQEPGKRDTQNTQATPPNDETPSETDVKISMTKTAPSSAETNPKQAPDTPDLDPKQSNKPNSEQKEPHTPWVPPIENKRGSTPPPADPKSVHPSEEKSEPYSNQKGPDGQKTVVVGFSGWTPEWQRNSGKSIPLDSNSTLTNTLRDAAEGRKNVAVKAYGTDSFDRVKNDAMAFIEKEIPLRGSSKQDGQIILYGYSWGGDTAAELSRDLQSKGYQVDTLITVDSATGPFRDPWNDPGDNRRLMYVPGVRDYAVPSNVKENVNWYTTTPNSGIGSQGIPNRAEDPSSTRVTNIPVRSGVSHWNMDEYVQGSVVGVIQRTIDRNK